jgi:trans-aconitate methyltransferase
MGQELYHNEWDAAHYDQHISYVSRLGAGLIDLLQPKAGERILDLGCGTGELAYQISRSGAKVLGLDSSASMVAEAKRKFPELDFIQGDGQSFDLQEAAGVDAIFSNAALHWMKQPELAAASMYRALAPGGRLVAEFGGKHNVGRLAWAIQQAVANFGVDGASRHPWYFPSIGEYGSLLEAAGFQVKVMEWFERPTPLDDGERGLANWLDAFAAMFFTGLSEEQRREAYQRCEELLRPDLWQGTHWVADYCRLRVIAVKLQA